MFGSLILANTPDISVDRDLLSHHFIRATTTQIVEGELSRKSDLLV